MKEGGKEKDRDSANLSLVDSNFKDYHLFLHAKVHEHVNRCSHLLWEQIYKGNFLISS